MARVLIAEPSADVRALVAHAVRRLGHEPLVPSGRVLPHAVDVLVLEPAYDGGVALARQLRRAQPRVAIIVCSIFPPMPELDELAPIAHILKPFQRAVLEEVLEAAVLAAH